MNRKRVSRRLALVALLALAGPLGADPLDAVKAADLAMAKAVKDSDRAAFETFLAKEVVFLDAPAAGRASAVASWAPFFGEKRRSLLQWQPDGGQVARSGDLAYTTGPYELRRTGPDGKVMTLTGRYLTLWQAGEGGQWQVWADGSQLDAVAGTFTTQLAHLWPAAGRPDSPVALRRKPLKTARSKAGDLLLVVGEVELEAGADKAAGRYATVSQAEEAGGWRALAEAWTAAPAQ